MKVDCPYCTNTCHIADCHICGGGGELDEKELERIEKIRKEREDDIIGRTNAFYP